MSPWPGRAEAGKNGALQAAPPPAGAAAAGGAHTYSAVNAYPAVNGGGAGAGDSPRSTSSRLSFEVEDAPPRAASALPYPNPNPSPTPNHAAPPAASLPAVLLLRDSLGGGVGNGVVARSPRLGAGEGAIGAGGARPAAEAPFRAAGAAGGGGAGEDAAARERPPAGRGKRAGRAGAPGAALTVKVAAAEREAPP